MSAEIIAIIGTNIVVVSVILTNMEAMCRRLESRLDVAATRENPKPSDASGGARGRPRALPSFWAVLRHGSGLSSLISPLCGLPRYWRPVWDMPIPPDFPT